VVREDAGTEMFVTGRRCRTAGVGLFAATDKCLLSAYISYLLLLAQSTSTHFPREDQELGSTLVVASFT
jgi:hypothetical protein